MSADVLRRAAAKMRERAEAATPGPWHVVASGMGIRTPTPAAYRFIRDDREHTVAEAWDSMTGREDAAHIASWHPAVALAVANWLDEQAGCLEEDATTFRFATPESREAMYADALAVARAYLGEPS